MSIATPSTAAARRARRHAAVALGAAALIGVTACGSGDATDGAEPGGAQTEASADASAAPQSSEASPGPTTDPSSGGEGTSSPDASSDEIVASVPGNFRGSDSTTLAPGEAERVLPGMRAAVVPAGELPGSVVTAERIQEMPDVPFGQPLPLDGVRPTGECGELVERIDTATVPHTVLLHTGYEVDPGSDAVLGPEATVASFLVHTPSTEDLVGPYGALPDTCGSVQGEDGTVVEFTPVEGVPGAVVVDSSGPRGEFTVTLGGVSAGHRHLSATFVQVDPDVAAEMLRTQVEAFRAAE